MEAYAMVFASVIKAYGQLPRSSHPDDIVDAIMDQGNFDEKFRQPINKFINFIESTF